MFAFNLNVWAVIVASLAAFLFGAIYYSKLIMGKKWMKYTGIKDQPNQKELVISLLGNYLALFVSAVILANFFLLLGIQSMQESLILAFWLWLGFTAMYSLNAVWWEKQKFALFAMHAFSNLVGILIMAAVLFTWA